jgi:hypothetical protein
MEGQAQQVASLVVAGEVSDLGEAGVDLTSLPAEGAAASAAMAGAQASVPWLGLQLRFPYAAGAALVRGPPTANRPGIGYFLRAGAAWGPCCR